MKNGLIVVAALLLIGCGKKDEGLPTAPDPNIIRFEQIERKLFEVEHEYMRDIDALKKEIDASVSQETEDGSDVDKRMMLQERKIETLSENVRKLEKNVAALRKSAARQLAQKEPRAERSVISVAQPQTELFPIGVYEVNGQTVVTGSHLSSLEVETGETYRDQYGKMAKRTRTELVEVNEYGYQVRFSAQNLTDDTVELSVSAGAEDRAITLPPGGVVKNASVNSAVGADLVVVANGMTERFPVIYQ